MKYNIRLHNTENGITTVDVTWAINVEMGGVVDKVGQLLWFKEKNPSTYRGNIIIEPVEEELHLPPCEEPTVEDKDEVPETYLRPGGEAEYR